MSSANHWKARTLLLVAAGLVASLMFVPYGYLAIYPFSLFGTFIHEVGHAVAAVATGGYVESMVVNLDTSGYVKSAGGVRPIVASAGYLGSVAVGAALLFFGQRRSWATRTLMVVGIGTLAATAFFGGYGGYGPSLVAFVMLAAGFGLIGFSRRSSGAKTTTGLVTVGGLIIAVALLYVTLLGGLLTWAIGLSMGGAILLIALYANKFIQHLTVLFLGVQISLDGLNSIQVLWNITNQGHGHNDAATMADYTGLPAEFWAICWGLMGIVVIGAAFVLFWRGNR